MITRRDIGKALVASAVAAALAPKRALASFGFGPFGRGGSQLSSYWWKGPYDGYTPNYYISPTANPANDGTTNTGSLSAPWSIKALNTQYTTYAGKVVGLMDGTYSLYTILGLPGAGNFSGGNWVSIAPGSNTGTYTTPTVVVSESLLGAVIDGQRAAIYTADPSLDWGEGLLGPGTYLTGYFYGSGIVIDGIKYTGGNYRFITNYGGAYPSGRGGNGNNGCDYLTVRNCYFTDLSYITAATPPGRNTAEVYSEGSYHIYIQNCLFDTFSAPSDQGRVAAVQFFSPTLDTQVEYCTTVCPSTGGNQVYWKAGPSPGHEQAVLRYCYLNCGASTSGAVPFLSDGCNVTTDTLQIYGNILVAAQGSAAIWFDNTGVDGFQGTWEFYNNTIVGNWSSKGMIYSTDNWLHPPTGVNFYNNIVVPSSTGGQTGDFQTPSLALIETVNHNLYPTTVSFGVANSSTYSTLAAWQSATSTAGHAADANSAQGSPLFVGTGTDSTYYQLQSGSPALTLASDGGQIGAWRPDGTVPYQRGSNFNGSSYQ